MKKLLFLVFIICAQIGVAQQSNKLAPTPPMGWNSWNWFGKQDINETIVRQVIDAMVGNGLKEAGYEYVVVDGGWRDTTLGPGGELRPNPQRFPHGMKALADYAHSKGLKFGLHTAPGTADCGGDQVGGFGHEKVQIHQFVEWGVDFIKLDQCQYKPGWTKNLVKSTYLKWKRLLDKSGRNILLSIHVHYRDSYHSFPGWFRLNSQMARTTRDIKAKIHGGAVFEHDPRSVMRIAEINNQAATYAGGGYWNDPDMLVTGDQGLSIAEQKVHFALWCIMSAPLMLGNDPRHMSPEEKVIITNKDAIAVDQDTTEQGTQIKVRGEREIWAKQLSGGRQAVLFINLSDNQAQDITLPFTRLGITDQAQIKDIFGKENLGIFTDSYTKKIQPHSGLFLIINHIN